MGVTNLQFELKAMKGELLPGSVQHTVHTCPRTVTDPTVHGPGVLQAPVLLLGFSVFGEVLKGAGPQAAERVVQLLFPLQFFTEHCKMEQRSPRVLPRGDWDIEMSSLLLNLQFIP